MHRIASHKGDAIRPPPVSEVLLFFDIVLDSKLIYVYIYALKIWTNHEAIFR